MLYPSLQHHLLRFSGPDAAAFLESQLTHKVAALAVGDWQWQGYCTPKGRLLATFALVRSGEDTFLAVVHQSLSASLAKRLTMYRLRSKLSIEVLADQPVWLALDAAALAALPASALHWPLGDGRAFVLATDEAPALVAAPESAETTAANLRWQQGAIAALQPEIEAATSERFVPQMLGWDTVQPGGGVSFDKGCFPGQEIVARAHYRGAVKRHLERLDDWTGGPLEPGAELTLPDGRVVEICNAAPSAPEVQPPRWSALVVAANT